MKISMPDFVKPRWLLAAAAGLAILALLPGLFREPPQTEDLTGPGRDYLAQLEQKDPDEVMGVLRARRREELRLRRGELLKQVKAGELSPFQMLQEDAVIMGDSRAEGYWYYGFVDQSRTLTGPGHTILDLKKQLDTLEAMNPQYIYLLYGLNDVKIGFWGNSGRFVEAYMEYVDMIRQRLPESIVVISSILPYQKAEEPTEPTTEPNLEVERMKNIAKWNQALKAACQEHGVIFVDNAQISQKYADRWEPDGIHVQRGFYQYWARNLVIAALEEGSSEN